VGCSETEHGVGCALLIAASGLSLMMMTLLLLAAPLAAADAPVSPPPPAPPLLRFPIEGGGSSIVCDALGGAWQQGAQTLRAQLREVGSTLDLPARSWYGGGGELPKVIELPPPERGPDPLCVRIFGGQTLVEGSGHIVLSGDNGTSWSRPIDVQYFESVAVSFGMRPYIAEEEGVLLVFADTSTGPLHSRSVAELVANITMAMPFASTAAAQTVTWRSPSASLLRGPETVLRFPLAALPALVNQDVRIEIALSDGRRFTKLKRFVRAPPQSHNATALAVQVDHSSRSLFVDGRPWVGVGWYEDGLRANGNGGFASFADQAEYFVHKQAPSGVNQAMICEAAFSSLPPLSWPAAGFTRRAYVVLDILLVAGRRSAIQLPRRVPAAGP
jgi:hypothetical protein